MFKSFNLVLSHFQQNVSLLIASLLTNISKNQSLIFLALNNKLWLTAQPIHVRSNRFPSTFARNPSCPSVIESIVIRLRNTDQFLTRILKFWFVALLMSESILDSWLLFIKQATFSNSFFLSLPYVTKTEKIKRRLLFATSTTEENLHQNVSNASAIF